ncbi:MAG: DMT family transporter [Desulfovibrio desulfuricans]|nr:DMT family transporter [Desulfovibrio desulfuricans]
MHNSFVGCGAALLATVVWSGNFVAARALYDSIPPWQFNFWRWAVAFAALLPFALRRLPDDWPAVRRHWRYLSLMGILGVTLMNTFIYKAAQSTESLNMALLMPASPVVILLLARVFYGEAIPPRRLLGMLTVLAGALILISRGDWQRMAALRFNPGDVWTLGGMFCFAVYSLLMRRRPQDVSPLGFNVATFGLGLLYALPCTLLEAWLLPLPVVTPALLTGVLYAGLGCSALAFWLWTVGIDRIGPVRAGILYYSLPVFAGAGSVLVLQEQIVPAQIAGGLLIIGGICAATVPLSHRRAA